MTCVTFKFSVCHRHLYLELRHNVDVTCSNVSGMGMTARVVSSVRLCTVVCGLADQWRWSSDDGGTREPIHLRAVRSFYVLFFCLNSMIFNVQYGHLLLYIIV